jgi:type 1 fimbria pilin
MNILLRQALLALCSIGLCNAALANVTFTGTLNGPPPCTIDSGNTIEVDFGDVGTNRVDGMNYRRGVAYTINCQRPPCTTDSGWEVDFEGLTLIGGTARINCDPRVLKLSINGTATTFDGSAVQTSVPELGIRVLQNNVPFLLNTPLEISLSSPPVLEVVPVKRQGVTLAPARFTAVATLLAEYE